MPFIVGFSNYNVLFCALMDASPKSPEKTMIRPKNVLSLEEGAILGTPISLPPACRRLNFDSVTLGKIQADQLRTDHVRILFA